MEYLSEYCQAAGFRGVSPSAGNVQAAFAIMGNGGDGAWSHACIGIHYFFIIYYFFLYLENKQRTKKLLLLLL